MQTHETPDQAASPPPRGRPDLPVQAIPAELRHLLHWVCWDRTPRPDGKPSKTPINPHTGANASVTDSATWASFEEAMAYAPCDARVGGLGFVLTDSDHWALDLDHVISPDGEVPPSVMRFLESLTPTYIERSPSGHGLHVIFRGDRPAELRRTKVSDAFGEGMNLEIFGGDSARYITVTGNVWNPDATGSRAIAEASPADVEAIQALLPGETKAKPAPTGSATPLPIGDEMAKATFALSNVPSDDYDEWIHVGMALHSAFGDAGRALWIEWSRKSVKFDEAVIDKHWRSFHDTPGGKTIAYVYWLAGTIDPGWRATWREGEVGMHCPSAGRASADHPLRTSPTPRRGSTAGEVLDRWMAHGPLIHVRTGGGPVFGTRMYLLGAPDAGKTALVVQILDQMLQGGLAVGVLAVDEEPEDMLQRFLQRRGWTRQQCEQRDPAVVANMRARVGSLLLRLYDSSFCIESAAKDLAEFASSHNARAALGVDSIQTARSIGEADGASRYEVVSARVHAIRQVATENDMIVIATSEMGRTAYRSLNSQDRASDMAAAKESGAIEYSARIAASLKSVEGDPDLVEMRIFKNKHGRTHALKETGIHLRIDRPGQAFTEDTSYQPNATEPLDAAKTARRDEETTRDAGRLALVLAKNPGVASKRCEELLSGSTPGRMGHGRQAAARGRLGEALVEVQGKATSKLLFVDGSKVSDSLLCTLSNGDRMAVMHSRPPASESNSGSNTTPAPTRPGAPWGGSSTSARRDAPAPPIGGGGASLGAGQGSRLFTGGAPGAGPGGANSAEHGPDECMPEKPKRRRKAKTGGGA